MTSPIVAVLLALLASTLFVVGAFTFFGERARIRALSRSVRIDDVNQPLRRRLNIRFVRTRLGRWLDRELATAGITRAPLEVLAVVASLTGLLVVLLWTLLAPVIGAVAALLGIWILRGFIGRARERRREAFVAQLPEIARVMSNGTSAGLSLPTTLAMASQELGEPARSELARVTDALRFGRDVESALDDLSLRMPSRETRVLIGTLAVSARSGGSLIGALRDISDTLEMRKETRREIRTTLSQAVATGYIVMALGVGVLFLLNLIAPGTVEKMTTSLVGQVSLVVSAGLFALGFFLIRRFTKVEA